MGKVKATFRIGDGPAITAIGRGAQTTLTQVPADPKGITILETFLAGWAVRLGAYTFDLKAIGVPVRSTRDGSHHARYYLVGSAELLEVSDPQKQKAAVAA